MVAEDPALDEEVARRIRETAAAEAALARAAGLRAARGVPGEVRAEHALAEERGRLQAQLGQLEAAAAIGVGVGSRHNRWCPWGAAISSCLIPDVDVDVDVDGRSIHAARFKKRNRSAFRCWLRKERTPRHG